MPLGGTITYNHLALYLILSFQAKARPIDNQVLQLSFQYLWKLKYVAMVKASLVVGVGISIQQCVLMYKQMKDSHVWPSIGLLVQCTVLNYRL